MKALAPEKRRGQILVIFAFVLIVLVAICVFAIDIGRLFTCQAELQNAVDAAALAGASRLTGMFTESERELVRTEAMAFAEANMVDGTPLHLADNDIVFGHMNQHTGVFTPEPEAAVIDSVRITGRRSVGSPDGPISLFFGPVFGWRQQNFTTVQAIGTQPRRFIMLTYDRSGSMCFDTTGVVQPTWPQSDSEGRYMVESPAAWYWIPYQVRVGSTWKTARFYGRDELDGKKIKINFLPPHIRNDAAGNGNAFRYFSRDSTSVQSGWLHVPLNITIYCKDNTATWYRQGYYSVVSEGTGYAYATTPIQPLQDAIDASITFVDLISAQDDNKCGFVSYGSAATLDQQLTDDWNLLKEQINWVDPRGATAEPDAMTMSNNELLSERALGYGHRIMILMTDGMANYKSGKSYDNDWHTFSFLGQNVTCQIHPTVAAAMEAQAIRARQAGIRIYTVAFGSEADQVLHPLIANYTFGAFYYAPNSEELTEIFVDIFRRLPAILTR
jgi:hypothetical protein